MTVSIFQQHTITGVGADWAVALPFDQFDPATGILADAVLTTAGTLSTAASIENLAPVAATVTFEVGATITATAPGAGAVDSITPAVGMSVNLGALQGTFDGTLDFVGPSGTVVPEITQSQTQVAVLTPGPGPGVPAVGSGTFDVTVSSYATSTVNGNGNLAVLLHSDVGAVVSLEYQATPPGSSSAGGVVFSEGSQTSLNWLGPIESLVTTTAQVVTLPSQTSGWAGVAAFGRFDPSLGTLVAINLNVGNTVAGTFAAENLESVLASVTMSESASMSVATPGTTSGVSATANDGDNLTLGAFDGSLDLAGASGQSDTIIDQPAPPPNWPAAVVYPFYDHPGGAALSDAAALAAFTGAGTIDLPVSTAGLSTVTGPSNLLSEITQHTGGTVSVSYVYAPVSPGATVPPTASAVSGPIHAGGAPWLPGLYAGSSAPAPFRTVGEWDAGTPRMMFIGGLMGGVHWDAQPNATFVIEPGATGTLADFSLTAGNRLDLTAVLAGAPLSHDLSNLGSFLSVASHAADLAGGVDTTISVRGPAGSASVVLVNGNPIAVADLLNDNALILPPR